MSTRAFPPVFGHTVRPLVGLTEAECFALAHAARRPSGAWWVQRDEDDRSHADITLISGDDGSDEAVPDEGALAFVLRREDGAVRLSRGRGEACTDLGAHTDVHAAMAAVRGALGVAAAAARWIEGGCRVASSAPRALRDPDVVVARSRDDGTRSA